MENSTVRIMTWNLWGRHHNPSKRMERILRTLQEVQPDIAAFQEIWGHLPDLRSSQAESIAVAMGYQGHYAKATEVNESFYFGNAIFARWPMSIHGEKLLTAGTESLEPRVAVYGVVSSPQGPIPVITSHLSWERNLSHVRKAQMSVLVEMASELSGPGWPPILMGDFNADPDSDEIRMLLGKVPVPAPNFVFQDAWEQGGDGSTGYTWTSNNTFYEATRNYSLPAMPWMRRRLDYIFIGLPDGQQDDVLPIQVERTWLEGLAGRGDEEGSDHYAVVTDLTPR
jgi:endonuclease/exonuclease/phosphatase family metal-dependent hydrolase